MKEKNTWILDFPNLEYPLETHPLILDRSLGPTSATELGIRHVAIAAVGAIFIGLTASDKSPSQLSRKKKDDLQGRHWCLHSGCSNTLHTLGTTSRDSAKLFALQSSNMVTSMSSLVCGSSRQLRRSDFEANACSQLQLTRHHKATQRTLLQHSQLSLHSEFLHIPAYTLANSTESIPCCEEWQHQFLSKAEAS